jgi:predicted metal-binding protein
MKHKGEKLDRLVKLAIRLGAVNAKVIRTSTVTTAAWVRMKCKYGCDGYNSSLCCPPHTPTPEETRKFLDCYSRAILIHCKKTGPVKKIVVQVEREIFLSGYYKAFGLGAGPCDLCKECCFDGCIHQDNARPSMESCGIDVFATARANGFPIKVVSDEQIEENHYGLVLID